MMSAVAGLVPDVSVVVSNAVSLHPVVNRLARLKLRWMIPPTARVIGYLDPQWGDTGAPWVLPKLITGLVRLTHRECDNMVCKLASYTYGTGEPTLWRHENLNRETHEWLRDEFADVPLTLLRADPALRGGGPPRGGRRPSRAAASLRRRGRRRRARASRSSPASSTPASSPRASSARTPGSSATTPAATRCTIVPNYGHLDVFMGAHAARDVFPDMLAELERT